MAIPNIFNEDKLERMNFKNQLFLSEKEFIREQNYHLFRRYLINSLLHGYGIAGIDSFSSVQRIDGEDQFRVSPGVGIDRLGKEIILLSEMEISPQNPEQWEGTIPTMLEPWYLIARHKEIIQDDPLGQSNWNGQQEGNLQIPEILKDIIIFTSSVLPPGPDENGIVIARWMGTAFSIDIEERVYIGNTKDNNEIIVQHINTTEGAHISSAITFSGPSFISNNVEGALIELASRPPSSHSHSSDHIDHTPSSESGVTSTNVKSALDELGVKAEHIDNEKAPIIHTHDGTQITIQQEGSITNLQTVIQEIVSEMAPVSHTHDSADILFDNFETGLVASNVQEAIEELVNRQSAVHNHSAQQISFSNSGTGMSATEVQSAIVELKDEKSDNDHSHSAENIIFTPEPTSGHSQTTVGAELDRINRIIGGSNQTSPLRVGLMDDSLSATGEKGGQVIITDPCVVRNADAVRAFLRQAPEANPLVVQVIKISGNNATRSTIATVTFQVGEHYPTRTTGVILGNQQDLSIGMDDVILLSVITAEANARYLSVSVEAEPVI